MLTLNRERTLVLVDDQPEFLRLARDLLARPTGLRVVGEASSGEEALRLMPRLESVPEAILLDVEMPGLDGFETARRLRAVAPGIRIILTSASDSRGYATAALAVDAACRRRRNLSDDAIPSWSDGHLA